MIFGFERQLPELTVSQRIITRALLTPISLNLGRRCFAIELVQRIICVDVCLRLSHFYLRTASVSAASSDCDSRTIHAGHCSRQWALHRD
jgi:hypothetical protein